LGQKRAGTHDPYAALRIREYRLFVAGRNLSPFGDGMQSLVVSWELYQRTGKAITLGNVGLVQALPIFLFALVAGHVADLYSRKWIAIGAQAIFCLCSLVLAGLSVAHAGVPLYYLCLLCATTARAFGNPARGALLPQVVPPHLLGSAVSWDTSIRRIAVMSGAALGGWLLARSGHASTVYLTTAILGFISILLLVLLTDQGRPQVKREPTTWRTLMAGIVYIRHTSIILATITLDLFAVLLGGATSLLPIYAKDILRVGPGGLGWLRAAPSAGALLMALSLAHLPPFRFPGRIMLWAVAGYGVATVVFGLAVSMPLALVALFMLGALDMISVVVRQTLVQTLTPNEMRGRVNAVNSVFINTSNEIGGFESGVVAQLTTPVFSVVSGGIGSVLVVVAAALIWPAIRYFDAHEPPRNDVDSQEG
jgi:MFS family permease